VAASVLRGGGGGQDASTSASGGQAAEEKAVGPADGSFPVTASGRNWSPGSVVAAVPEIVAGAAGPLASPPSGDTQADGGDADGGGLLSASPDGATARLAGGPELAECVGNLNLGPVTPLGVDLARWDGNPAAVIILPTPEDPTSADLYVVTPQCPRGEFLYFARVARP
jgi:hypothetical protein